MSAVERDVIHSFDDSPVYLLCNVCLGRTSHMNGDLPHFGPKANRHRGLFDGVQPGHVKDIGKVILTHLSEQICRRVLVSEWDEAVACGHALVFDDILPAQDQVVGQQVGDHGGGLNELAPLRT